MSIELKVGDHVVVWVGLEYGWGGYTFGVVTEVFSNSLKVKEVEYRDHDNNEGVFWGNEYEVVWCERFKAWTSKEYFDRLLK